MASGKRASMREGPLAALFRRTDEAAEEAEAAARAAEESAAPVEKPQDPRGMAAREARQTSLDVPGEPPPRVAWGAVSAREDGDEPRPEPAAAAREEREPEPEVRVERLRPEARRDERPDEPPPVSRPTTAAGESAAREREYPHPSLGAGPAPPEEPAPRAPSPRERLRQAFSSDLPEDILERPAPPPPAPPASAPSFSAREGLGEEPAWGQARRSSGPDIRVIGVGGAGVNAVNRMVEAELTGVDFVAINTDAQSLAQSSADVTIHIGPNVTRGLGAGSNPDVGRQAAMEEHDRIKAHLKGSDMVFIAAGAGGGTGTGGAPVVARIARELGALTVGIITKPFGFEGKRRAQAAEQGIEALADEVDTLIVVPNNRLLSVLDKQTSMVEAFRVADDVLRQ